MMIFSNVVSFVFFDAEEIVHGKQGRKAPSSSPNSIQFSPKQNEGCCGVEKMELPQLVANE